MNCLIVDDEPLARSGLRRFAEKVPALEAIRESRNAREALAILQKEQIDVLFLDIQMPGMSGLDLLARLEHRPAVVLTTAFPNYAVKGFDLEVQDYLLKPFSFERFKKAVRKARAFIDRERPEAGVKTPPYTYLKANGILHRIKNSDIFYIQALQNYVVCVTRENRYIAHNTLKSVLSRLPEDTFVRVHRSYIINTGHIEKLTSRQVLIDGESIPISRLYRHAVHNRIMNTKYVNPEGVA